MDPETMTAEEIAEYLERLERDYQANANVTDDDPLDCNPNLW